MHLSIHTILSLPKYPITVNDNFFIRPCIYIFKVWLSGQIIIPSPQTKYKNNNQRPVTNELMHQLLVNNFGIH